MKITAHPPRYRRMFIAGSPIKTPLGANQGARLFSVRVPDWTGRLESNGRQFGAEGRRPVAARPPGVTAFRARAISRGTSPRKWGHARARRAGSFPIREVRGHSSGNISHVRERIAQLSHLGIEPTLAATVARKMEFKQRLRIHLRAAFFASGGAQNVTIN